MRPCTSAAAVQLLLDRGARTTIRNHWQETALDLAQRDGLDAIADLIAARDEANAHQISALAFVAAIKASVIGEVERLNAAKAPVNERVSIVGSIDDDYTPLGLAARAGRADIVRALLDAGADPRQAIGLMAGIPVHEAAYFGEDANTLHLLAG